MIHICLIRWDNVQSNSTANIGREVTYLRVTYLYTLLDIIRKIPTKGSSSEERGSDIEFTRATNTPIDYCFKWKSGALCVASPLNWVLPFDRVAYDKAHNQA